MIHVNNLESHGYNFQVFHLDDKTDLHEIDEFNQGYLMSVRFFPRNDETEKECWNIFERCTPDILVRLKELREENKSFYDHFNCTDNFSHKSISAYREDGKERINFMEMFYDTKLRQDDEE